MNADRFIDFLKTTAGKHAEKGPSHRRRPSGAQGYEGQRMVREKADGRLTIVFLPPYSPDLNLDEWV
jgi:transposase